MGCENRVKRQDGYILIKVGKDHHLAHADGYAFEHRVIAEKNLKRRLEKNETVHHINGIKDDNRPSNIKVCPSRAHHIFEHRAENCNRKHPDEKNVWIECACGCGQKLLKYGSQGRPKKAIDGHRFKAPDYIYRI